MRTFYPYTKGYRQWILLGMACSIAEAVLELELPQAMSDIVDVGIASGDRRYIMLMGLKMLVLALLALAGGVGAAVFAATLKPDIKSYVVVHEITHAVLFEANAGNYDSKETFVEALAWQLLYFLQDNDLSILKPEGE